MGGVPHLTTHAAPCGPAETAGADEIVDHTTTEVTAAVTEPVDVVLNLAPVDPATLPGLIRSGGVLVNTTAWMPAPSDEERGVRGIDLFVNSDAAPAVAAGGAGRLRRTARRRGAASAAGRAVGRPHPGRQGCVHGEIIIAPTA
ncbi:hypothetical protein ABZ235_07045 [Streptomyces canus]